MGFHGLQNQVKWRFNMSKAAELAKSGDTLTNQPSGRKNIAFNGAMQVAQRGTSATGIGNADIFATCDRWEIQGSSAGRLTMTQTADGPSGFANCIKLDCTTADTSIATGEYLILRQLFEGQDLQQIKKGTSDAELITVSFYVKASAAFNFNLELFDRDNSRGVSKLFATTTDWVKHSITFPADTTGAFDDDNAHSLDLAFWLHAGASYTGGTLQTSWIGNTNANRAAGISSFYSSTDNNFFITGVQMEIGSQATSFEDRSFGDELSLCRRYYWDTYNGVAVGTNTGTTGAVGMSADGNNYQNIALGNFPTTMRTTPTMAIYNPITGTAGSIRGDSSNFSECTILNRGVNFYCFNMNNVAIGANTFVSGHVTADAEL